VNPLRGAIMKRDMDLARRILAEVEGAPFDLGGVKLNLPDVDDLSLQYHLLLLSEASLIEVIDVSDMSGPAYIPVRLTWRGHEFVESARNDSIWSKAKNAVATKTGGMAFDVLSAVLKEYATRAVLNPSAV
jgi:hypothetical protein